MAPTTKSSLVDSLLTVVTAPELYVGVLLFFVRYMWEYPYEVVGNSVIQASDFGKNATLVFPTVLLGGNIGLAGKILSPLSRNRILVAWPDYARLRRRVYFSVSITILALLGCIVASAFASAAFSTPVGKPRLGQLITVCLATSAASVVTMLFASFKMKELTEHLKDEK